MNTYFLLTYVFFKIGLLTVGGGYAMLPMLEKEVVEKYKWATYEEILDYYAIGQSTPGIIAINTATFIGYKKKGILGAVFATLGMVLPSLIIITILAASIKKVASVDIIKKAFAGIRVCVVVLILNATYRMAKKAIIKPWQGVVCFISFMIIVLLKQSVILVIVLLILSGLFYHMINRGREN